MSCCISDIIGRVKVLNVPVTFTDKQVLKYFYTDNLDERYQKKEEVHLVCNKTITIVPQLSNLTILHMMDNQGITRLPYLLNLTELYCDRSQIEEISGLNNLEVLYCAQCPKLKTIRNLPKLRLIFCMSCPVLETIHDLPNVLVVYCSNSPKLAEISNLYKVQKIVCNDCVGLMSIAMVPNTVKVEKVNCPLYRDLSDKYVLYSVLIPIECPICFVLITAQDPAIYKHTCTEGVFHERCIVRWYSKKGTCPICRN